MRTLLKVSMPTIKGDDAFATGTLQQNIQSLLERLHAEAAYFLPMDGRRTALVIFDMRDPSQMPSISEPLFRELGAEVEYYPVMNQEDLTKGLSMLNRGT